MIYAIVGNTGGGKSYLAVQLIIKALSEGRAVVTNVPLHYHLPPFKDNSLLYSWDWDYISPESTKELDYPLGALYVLDEVWRGFMHGNLAKNLGEKCLEFFKEHRHRKNNKGVTDDIFLITQDYGDVPKCVRQLAKQTILCEKPDEIGMPDLTVRYYLKGAQTGLTVDGKEIVKTEKERIKPEIYNLYISHSKATETTDNAVNEGSAIQSTVYQSWRFKLGRFGAIICLIVFPICIYYLYKVYYPKLISPKSNEQLEKNINTPVQPIHIDNYPPPQVEIVKPIESTRWRIVAYIANTAKHTQAIYIQDQSRRPRRIDVQLCTQAYNQYSCILDGEVITIWSGQQAGSTPFTAALPFGNDNKQSIFGTKKTDATNIGSNRTESLPAREQPIIKLPDDDPQSFTPSDSPDLSQATIN